MKRTPKARITRPARARRKQTGKPQSPGRLHAERHTHLFSWVPRRTLSSSEKSSDVASVEKWKLPLCSFDRETWTDDVWVLYRRLQRRDYTAVAPLLELDYEFLYDGRVAAALKILKHAPDLRPYMSESKRRSELKKIGNIIARCAPLRSKWHSYGDQLKDELDWLAKFIETNHLFRLQDHPQGVAGWLAIAIYDPTRTPYGETEEERDARQKDEAQETGALVSDLPEDYWLDTAAEIKESTSCQGRVESRTARTILRLALSPEIQALAKSLCDVLLSNPGTRKSRSWAIKALAHYYSARSYHIGPKHIENSIARHPRNPNRRVLPS